MRSSILAAALLTVFLGGCNVTTPSQIKTGDIQLKQQTKTVALRADTVSPGDIDRIAGDYHDNARGPMFLVVSYAGSSPANEIEAKAEGAKYKKAFAEQGIDLQADVAPVDDKSLANRAVISYRAIAAVAPDNCRMMTGMQGGDAIEDVQKYSFGCEMKSQLSQMIAKPDDLMGTDGLPDTDSRRDGQVVEKYKSGKPNDKLNGLNASTVGTGG